MWAPLVAQTVKNPPAVLETCVQSLGWEDPLEEGMATHSSVLAWRTPWRRSLADCSPWGRKELETPEHSAHVLGVSHVRVYMYKRTHMYVWLCVC